MYQLRWVSIFAFLFSTGCTSNTVTPTTTDTEMLSDITTDTLQPMDSTSEKDSFIEDIASPPDISVLDTAEPDLGPPADPQVCTGQTDGQLQAVGGACCYTSVDHPSIGLPLVICKLTSACLDAQCEDGYCASAKYCTKGCSFLIDQVNNHTGAEGYDGIQDTSLPDDCMLAADGPTAANTIASIRVSLARKRLPDAGRAPPLSRARPPATARTENPASYCTFLGRRRLAA